MNLSQLKVKNGARGAIIGQTGTGKSFLAKRLLPKTEALSIIDPKRQFDYDLPTFDSVRAIKIRRPKRFIYRPKPEEFLDVDRLSEVYRYCYERGDIFVYTDDAVGVIDRYKYPKFLAVAYQMGREHGLTMLASFQRPARVPLFLVSEASQFYCFRLTLGNDVRTVQEYCAGYSPDMLTDMHTFAYYDVYKMERAKAVRLQLQTQRKEV